MKIKINIDLKVGRVVKYFILADLALLAGWGLVQPVFSIYILDKVEGTTLVTLGMAAAIYWILKSILQLPVANYLDKTDEESDDFRALIISLFIGALAAFSFILVRQIWHLYVVEVIHAIAFALYVPAWSAIFSRHVDKNRVSFDWSLDSTVAGISAGVSGFLGGVIAKTLGFSGVFVLAGAFSLVSAFILLMAPELILPKKTSGVKFLKDHTPTNINK
ncbi:MAG: MFS transporter [Candidatus Liptonbacteria bacterium]|nr:MFS transporter [Candidatus Liptonbacteria bacterium]